MKTFLKILLIIVVIIGSFKLAVATTIFKLSKPITVEAPAEEPVMDEVEVEVEDPAEEPVEEPAEPEEPKFDPLPFNGRGLKKFAEKYNGRIINVAKIDKRAADLGGKKGVLIGGDVYFKGKGGALYVFHNGDFIKLN